MTPMETKKNGTATVVTEGAAQAALRRGPARRLDAQEERVLRMRLGATPPRGAPLERAAEPLTDLEIEVLSYELEAYMKWRARRPTSAGAVPIAPRASRTKEKIVRALRKKG